MRPALFAAAVLVAAPLVAHAEERTLELPPFEAIAIEGAATVEAVAGQAQSVVIDTSPEMWKRLDVRVDGTTLRITTRDGGWFDSGGDPVRATISAPALRSFAIAGSGAITARDLKSDAVSVAISGSGTTALAGTCQSFSAAVQGSGDVRAKELSCANATAAIAGSGSVVAFARESASAEIAGSGDVVFHGSPKSVQQSVAGSGNVTTKP